MKYVTRELIEHIKQQYTPDWRGVHGIAHWSRVYSNGMTIARETNANIKVVELFAFLHDSRRWNDGGDPEHGLRAADWLQELRESFIDLDENEYKLLYIACRDHTGELFHDDKTIATCWDADRLDLGRVGITPDANYLNTKIAKSIAYSNSNR